MSFLRNALEALSAAGSILETFDRHGERVRSLTGWDMVDAVARFRSAISRGGAEEPKVVALLFKPEETIEFLVASFAALAEGYTIVPLYPNWSAETQLAYIDAYRL